MSQAFHAQILLPVDVRNVAPVLRTELLIYGSIEPGNVRVGFFHVNHRGISIELLAQSECFDLLVDEDSAPFESQFLEVG